MTLVEVYRRCGHKFDHAETSRFICPKCGEVQPIELVDDEGGRSS